MSTVNQAETNISTDPLVLTSGRTVVRSVHIYQIVGVRFFLRICFVCGAYLRSHDPTIAYLGDTQSYIVLA